MKKFLPALKKYFPFILFGLGFVFVVGAIIFVISGKKNNSSENREDVLRTVSFDERPVASLTPTEDGHWLKLKVEKLLSDAAIMDYELLYTVADGRTQGVPGSIKLKDLEVVERELLLGSESSGKYRYDEGVKKGTLTLRFRTEKGGLIAKFSTDFSLFGPDDEKLVSSDGVFTSSPDDREDAYVVIMQTFGVPKEPPVEVNEGVYGVFSSKDLGNGIVSMSPGGDLYHWGGSGWNKLESFTTPTGGIFVKAK